MASCDRNQAVIEDLELPAGTEATKQNKREKL